MVPSLAHVISGVFFGRIAAGRRAVIIRARISLSSEMAVALIADAADDCRRVSDASDEHQASKHHRQFRMQWAEIHDEPSLLTARRQRHRGRTANGRYEENLNPVRAAHRKRGGDIHRRATITNYAMVGRRASG